MSPKHVDGDTRTHSSFDHRLLTIVCTASYIAEPHACTFALLLFASAGSQMEWETPIGARPLLANLHSGFTFPGVSPRQRDLNDYVFELSQSPKDQGDLISPRETHPFDRGA
jgi:hypothetical protein